MKQQIIKILLLFIIITSYLSANDSVKIIAYACYSCHGEKLINLQLTQPLSQKELTNTLLAFKTNRKNATIMDRISKGFSDAELKAVATYLSNNP